MQKRRAWGGRQGRLAALAGRKQWHRLRVTISLDKRESNPLVLLTVLRHSFFFKAFLDFGVLGWLRTKILRLGVATCSPVSTVSCL